MSYSTLRFVDLPTKKNRDAFKASKLALLPQVCLMWDLKRRFRVMSLLFRCILSRQPEVTLGWAGVNHEEDLRA